MASLMLWLASIPRSGSTYLLRSICGLPQGGNTPPGIQEAHDLRKTHLRPDAEPIAEGATHGRIVDKWQDGDRALFVFGDITASVLSTMRMRHSAGHWGNCGQPEYSPDDDLMEADLLGYEALFDAWTNPPFPVLCLKYECLHYPLIRRVVEGWVQRDVHWLPWEPRRTQPTDGERERAMGVYGDLHAKIRAAPGFQVARP